MFRKDLYNDRITTRIKRREVVDAADAVGSTEFIRNYVKNQPEGSVIGVGTEINMVKRLQRFMQASQENAIQTALIEAIRAAMDDAAAMNDDSPLSTSMIHMLRGPFTEAGNDSIKVEALWK